MLQKQIKQHNIIHKEQNQQTNHSKIEKNKKRKKKTIKQHITRKKQKQQTNHSKKKEKRK